ncbi:type II secretion system protein GspM [Solimonas marina]|uniref:Type II secretion system protein M n=1 Tax=Solimonas marina TaxID=2714601 RepID=A0A969WAV5_9GAMM|nr:type II secretion system protein M [Solimonas marina]NKF23143.1 type II secretion system protein M [Solimonas marina]
MNAKFNATLEQWQSRATAAYEQLQPRERIIVLSGAAVLIVMILYLAIWEPLVVSRKQDIEALQSSRALATRIEMAASLAQSHSQGKVDRSATLLSVVDQTTRSGTLGKAPSRVQPEGSGEHEVRVWFDDVPFDNCMRWLGELQSHYGIHVSSTEIDTGSAPGLVNARFTLSR